MGAVMATSESTPGAHNADTALGTLLMRFMIVAVKQLALLPSAV